MHASGLLTASRIRMQSDIWKFPVTGSPAENTRGAVRITHQTGQARTPSVSPDESEVVYCPTAAATAISGSRVRTAPACVRLRSSAIPRFGGCSRLVADGQ